MKKQVVFIRLNVGWYGECSGIPKAGQQKKQVESLGQAGRTVARLAKVRPTYFIVKNEKQVLKYTNKLGIDDVEFAEGEVLGDD